MEAAVQSTLRCSINAKIPSEKTPRRLVSKILEESKQLEYLNRKISKSSGRNIIKQISVFRKMNPDFEYPEHLFPNPYELNASENLQIPSNSMNASKVRQRFASLFAESQLKKKDFYDVEFKSCLWPEDSVIDPKMFELMNSNSLKKDFNIWVDIKPKFRKLQIKSRIGEIERNNEKNGRKTTSRVQRRVQIRSSSPWTYVGDCRSVMATPFVGVSRGS